MGFSRAKNQNREMREKNCIKIFSTIYHCQSFKFLQSKLVPILTLNLAAPNVSPWIFFPTKFFDIFIAPQRKDINLEPPSSSQHETSFFKKTRTNSFLGRIAFREISNSKWQKNENTFFPFWALPSSKSFEFLSIFSPF